MWFSVFKISTIPVKARKLAMKDAKQKTMCVSFRAKVGKAVTITDNSQNYQPQPFMQG
jgi:uncharacterized protein YggE